MHDLRITDPVALENAINQIVGVVTVGLFAARPADLVILGGADGVRQPSSKGQSLRTSVRCPLSARGHR